jgi:hypothetical protein
MKKIAVLLMSLFSVSAFASHYGDAGCGLGTMVLGKDSNQVLVATVNGTGMQSFAILSGTSGCVDEGAVAKAKAVPAYIEVNQAALTKEAARGNGETLAGLAELMGCKSEVFGPAVKSNYNKIFSSQAPKSIQSNIESMVQSNPSGACGV